MESQIFLDSDGVLFDFDSHVMKHTNGIHPRKIPDVELWKIINAIDDFWITMPKMPGSDFMVNWITEYFNHKPIVITGCPKSNFEFAAEQKKKKYAEYYPGIEVITCLSRDKPLHMKNAGDILIDDFKKNVKNWRKAGGRAILYKNHEQAINDLLWGIF